MKKLTFAFLTVVALGLAAALSPSDFAPLSAAFAEDHSVLEYDQVKTRYYELFERVDDGRAVHADIAELMDLCKTWEFDLPLSLRPIDPEELETGNPILSGGSNCAGATLINAVPFTDSGNLDGDDDCTSPAPYPYNDLFYRYVPSFTDWYEFRLLVHAPSGNVAMRIMSTQCCISGLPIAATNLSVTSDCDTARATYLRARLTQGTQYWIHVGDNNSGFLRTSAYEFQMIRAACPAGETALAHSTCAAAQSIACNDSLLGDSATAANPDWYSFTLAESDCVNIYAGGREFGHCISGAYPLNPSAIDARLTLFGACGDSLGYADDEACSFDARISRLLAAGTYRIKVWNRGTAAQEVLEYLLKITCTPALIPVDCALLLPCGAPAESEPNDVCGAAGILPVPACGSSAYGVICPETDVDYWYVPPIDAGQRLRIELRDGEGCNTWPPVSVALRNATGAGYGCAVPFGDFQSALEFGGPGCMPWPGGYLAVCHVAGAPGRYRLEATCRTDTLPATCALSEIPESFCSQSCAALIPGGSRVRVPVDVDVPFVITDLNVRVNITHGMDSDLSLWLVTPWNDSLLLSAHNGGGGDHYRDTRFDDEADSAIAAGHAPFTGSYRPQHLLAMTDGYLARGTWSLVVYDSLAENWGFLKCFCLEFEGYEALLLDGLYVFAAPLSCEAGHPVPNPLPVHVVLDAGGYACDSISVHLWSAVAPIVGPDSVLIPYLAAGEVDTITFFAAIPDSVPGGGCLYFTAGLHSANCGDSMRTICVTLPDCAPHCEFPATGQDYGDLSACGFPTLPGNPAHALSGIAWLGDSVTADTAPQIFNWDRADDGVYFLALPWSPCLPKQVQVRVTAGPEYGRYVECGGALYLSAWKDGNFDGDFCDELCDGLVSEWIIQDVPVTPGEHLFTIMDPGIFYIGHYDGVFRFRLLSRPAQRYGFGLRDTVACPGMPCGGYGADMLGEVEDYFIPDGQLSTELLSFAASSAPAGIVLRWATASESRIEAFELERDGVLLARLDPSGDIATGADYSHTDPDVASGVRYRYTLTAIELSGQRLQLESVEAMFDPAFETVHSYALHANFPNPFNPSTTLAYDLPEAGQVRLTVFNVMGQRVSELVNCSMPAGRQRVVFDAAALPSGVYIARFETNGFVAERKMLLMK